MMQFHHVPIMLPEVMELLKPERGGLFVDGTLGGGGHSGAAGCSVTSGEEDAAVERIIKECGFDD